MIIVTGGTGFVGTAVSRAIRNKGKMVTAVSRTKRPRPVIKTGGGIEFRTASLSDPAALDVVMKDATAVVHLVGVIFPPKGSSFEKVHVEGTRNVVEAAKRAGVKRYLHMSALGARLNGPTPYFRTKAQAEEIVKSSGLDWTIFRPSIVYGEDDDFVNRFAGMAKALPFMPVIGSGKSKMQPIWVEDVAMAFATALVEPRTIGRSFDLGGPEQLTMLQILDIIMRAVGKKRPKLHIPVPIMMIQAALFEAILPNPPVTRDQIKMLGEDNVCSTEGLLDVFPLKMQPLEEGVRYYL